MSTWSFNGAIKGKNPYKTIPYGVVGKQQQPQNKLKE
jgi:hypothetical protein